MEKTNKEIMELWKESATVYNGNKMLFWSGRMYIASQQVINAKASNISRHIQLLDAVATCYNDQVLHQTFKDK